jgi:cobyrinic acid a,c-diamide synthase
MAETQKRLMIAAPQSGSGKTTVTLGLLGALVARGIAVRAAKAGPDYIDPGWHGLACGKSSVNLDPWAMTRDRLEALALGRGGTHLLVEAMMGLFDGASDGRGSAADLAAALGSPVVLVIDAAKQSHSVAALAQGFAHHRPDIRMAGVILNRVGGARHEAMLRDAMRKAGIEILGVLPRDPALALPERHLGLVQAGESGAANDFLASAAKFVEAYCDIVAILPAFAPAPMSPANAPPPSMRPLGQRMAIARDAAFSFLYAHQLADWRKAGAAISFFSPLADEGPAADADAVFLPGGYPELHAGRIAAAGGFRSAMAAAAARGAFIYGECGGYMTLGEGLEDAAGVRHRMLGLLALETSFARRALHLGYRRVAALGEFTPGRRFTGHEFHYSLALREEGERLFTATDATGLDLGPQGLRAGRVAGSYLHLIDAVEP